MFHVKQDPFYGVSGWAVSRETMGQGADVVGFLPCFVENARDFGKKSRKALAIQLALCYNLDEKLAMNGSGICCVLRRCGIDRKGRENILYG